jgi:hypothetical protein
VGLTLENQDELEAIERSLSQEWELSGQKHLSQVCSNILECPIANKRSPKMRASRSVSSLVSAVMSPVQQQFCLKITEKMIKLPISTEFRDPVDPLKVPGYFEKIKRPMDLNSVMRKLADRGYPSAERWKEDMNLIWKNAMTYNAENSVHYRLAKELNDYFRGKCDSMPRTELELWVGKIAQALAKLMKLLEAKPEERRPTLAQANVAKPARLTKILLRQKSQSHLGE